MPLMSLRSFLLTNLNLPALHLVELRRRGGTATSILTTEHFRVLVHALLGKVLYREVRRVLHAEDFGQPDNLAELLLLQPQDANI